MSYIRSTSNPEKLYIFGSREGVEIYQGSNYKGTIPYPTWKALCQEYVNFSYDDTEELVIDDLWLKWDWVEDSDGRNYKAILGYKDEWEIPMWAVTWGSITSRYEPEDV